MRQLQWIGAVLALLFVAGSASAAEVAQGEIKTVAADKNQFVLTLPSGKDQLYTLTNEAKLSREGKEAKLGDLKAGDNVVVRYVTIDNGLYAVGVEQHPADKFGSKMTATFKEFKGGNQFVLTHEGKDLLFTLTDNGRINTAARLGDSLRNIKTGTEVTVNYVKMGNGGLYADCIDSRGAPKP